MEELLIGFLWINLIYHFAVMLNVPSLWEPLILFTVFYANFWFNIYASVLIYKLKNKTTHDYLTIFSILLCNFSFYFFQVKVYPYERIVFRLGFNELNLDVSTWKMPLDSMMITVYLLVIGSGVAYLINVSYLKLRVGQEKKKEEEKNAIARKKASAIVEYVDSGDDSDNRFRGI